MTFDVKPEAQDDARQAALRYDRAGAGLGAAFLRRLRDGFDLIQQQPQSFSPVQPAVRGREIRYYIMRQFPYSIIYELDPGRIVVLAVVHHQRRPGRWRHRLAP